MATDGAESPAWGERLMEAICDPENIDAAVRAVRRNKGAPGIDGMTVTQLPDVLERRWPDIARALVEGAYRPQPVKRVQIPKPDGGIRNLGIPTVIDRVIQQAVLQRRQPVWDPTFSASSYGFRPGRSAQQAVAAAQAYVAAGRQYVVDIDLAKFFDRVNHDRLMAAVAERVRDKRVLGLIRSLLTAGALNEGAFELSQEGTPQGGPLSPLLSNLVLDELDRELERRGLSFVRYADDCNIHVASRKAAERVMASMTRFIERRLKLTVNEAKSAVDWPWNRSFLGFTLKQASGFPRAIAVKAVARFKNRVRDLTRRYRGVSLKTIVADLNPLLRGWAGYFGFSESHEFEGLDGWIRRRLRSLLWVQWKTRRKRLAELMRRGVAKSTAFASIMSPKGPWRISASEALHRALRNKTFKREGLVSMDKLAHA
ncbi:group II intron reverse transcriptase/maturase [Methylocapsa sp. S129]|uniref:group II intron reverse transcriptase/maturase n=1 Tax=Methylocapsa sp. S129 TaxID=1641869 RepID=UPI00131E7B92|nr:group II intron reverse transcriptase/maturase [Methylocapsa sp. S129]